MKYLGLRSLKQLITWSLSAKKDEIAKLAPLVLLKWKKEEEIAKCVIEESIADLCADCICLVEKLQKGRCSSEPPAIQARSNKATNDVKLANIYIGLTGSLLSKDKEFAEEFRKRLRSELLQRGVSVSFNILQNTALGSLKMLDKLKWKIIPQLDLQSTENVEVPKVTCDENEKDLVEKMLPVALGLSLTERRNEKSMNLDKMNIDEAIDLMINEEESIFHKISEHKNSIRILIEKVCHAFQNGGRLFYVGAGTSGRLGILDASECPPTFKSPREWVQGIIAGGFSSVSVAKEEAEDSILDGMKAIDEKNVNHKDIVFGK